MEWQLNKLPLNATGSMFDQFRTQHTKLNLRCTAVLIDQKVLILLEISYFPVSPKTWMVGLARLHVKMLMLKLASAIVLTGKLWDWPKWLGQMAYYVATASLILILFLCCLSFITIWDRSINQYRVFAKFGISVFSRSDDYPSLWSQALFQSHNLAF